MDSGDKSSIHYLHMPWFVLYTKSRNEKAVAERLRAMDIAVYCPLIRVKRTWSDRTKVVEEPLFRSYCFVHLEEYERANVFKAPGVVRYLYWLQKPAIVRDTEIDAIKWMLNEVDHSQIEIRNYKPGDRLTVASGNFAEVTGQVVGQQGKQVTIRLDAMNFQLTVDQSKTVLMQ